MPDLEENLQYSVAGSIKLNNQKIALELSGVRSETEKGEKKVHATNINPIQLNLDRTKKNGFLINSNGEALLKDRPMEKITGLNMEDSLVMLILQIPGINEPDPQGRNRLFGLIKDVPGRRITRKTISRNLDNPEEDVRSIVDFLIYLDQAQDFVSQLLTNDMPSDLKQRISDWHRQYFSSKRPMEPDDTRSLLDANYRASLVDRIEHAFDVDELVDLCSRMDVYIENMSGGTKKAKIWSFVKYLERRKQINELVALLVKLRQNFDWEQPNA
ncbi:MAG: hypothetical protein CL609_07475 [Anaerolineaceae bacterium]|nr:hypothetical protein [Anaerolineaceae bacterium]